MQLGKLLKPLHFGEVAIGLLLSSCAQFESAHNTDLAKRGNVAHFGPYTAAYVGTGQ